MADMYEVGDVVRLKKKHPCGSFEWEIGRGKVTSMSETHQ